MITELGGKTSSGFRRNYFLPLDDGFTGQKEAFIRDCGNTDVFQCIYRYEAEPIDSSPMLAPLYFDLDDTHIETDYDTIQKMTLLLVASLHEELRVPLEDVRLFFSGHKGFHVLIDETVFGLPSLVRLNEIYKYWAGHFASTAGISLLDLKIYDRRRLFRLPNTRNGATGLYKVPVTLAFLERSTYETMKEYASAPKFFFERKSVLHKPSAVIFLQEADTFLAGRKPVKAAVPKQDEKKLLPCVEALLEGGIVEGSRNQSASLLSNALLQAGYSDGEVETIMESWNQTNDPPLPDTELRATLRSSRNMVASGARYGCQSFRDLGVCPGCEIGGIHG